MNRFRFLIVSYSARTLLLGAALAAIRIETFAQEVFVYITVAGKAGASGSNDGTATEARFNAPSGVAVDRAGNVFIADDGNGTIRKLSSSGEVTTIAGKAGLFGATEGVGANARFSGRSGKKIVVAADGQLFVSDSGNHTIRRISPEGFVTTFAGASGLFGYVNSQGGAARFAFPTGISFDARGQLVVAEAANETIRRVSLSQVVTTIAGAPGYKAESLASRTTIVFNGLPPEPKDGVGAAAQFNAPSDVTVDASENIYVLDRYFTGAVRKISPNGTVTTIAGTLKLDAVVGPVDGNGPDARF